MTSDVAVRHDPQNKMFYIDGDGGRAYLSYMDLGKQTMDIYRTFVPDARRGHGLAARLAAEALNYAQERGYTVIASCSYVERYMQRQQERG
ncbi:GNAT family N-acetyltransferase [Pseudomonas sp. MYb185]|uniref:GNAT family N-acetyltransferase n=1 Tax=Pseudomonas sp. MYb185 TaxID=1848729 RepID=UPI000CFAE7D5|nr:GNAT family N-acetyltransferase [Pseudomonas sp. MYb185]PRB81375.1 GNAT family N-acetyltransferase [Pseudomonas sp. MYb185]